MALSATERKLRKVLKALVRVFPQPCDHTNTHRGGAIWTICDDCGGMFADDRGGVPKPKVIPELEAALRVLGREVA